MPASVLVPSSVPAPAAARTVTFRGWGMDTCGAPSTGTLTRWRTSRYRALGIYFGGRGRACPQPRLTPGWVRAVDRMGWRLLPVYAGSQAPCVSSGVKRHVAIGRHPARQGTAEGRDAVRRAHALGLLTGSALYLDVESYDRRKKSCARRVLSFVRAWDREVGNSGYLPGFYSSADTGVRHIEGARRAGVEDLPAVMWFARWRGAPRLYGEPALRRSAWRGRRIHQYAGNVRERHGGRTLLIDRNLVDAPVARVEGTRRVRPLRSTGPTGSLRSTGPSGPFRSTGPIRPTRSPFSGVDPEYPQ